MSENSEKLKALQLTLDKLDKTYGKGTVMKLSDERVIDVPAIPTGSLGLDIALGIGGFPEEGSLKFMVRNRLVKQPWQCTASQRHRKVEDLPHLSMQNMHSTSNTLKNWESILKTF